MERRQIKEIFFNGTCLMLRRSSLPLIGLVDSNVLLADMEYTLRMTGVVNLTRCTGIISVWILNPQSSNLIYKKRAEEDSARLCLYYNYKYPWERSKEELQKRSIYRKFRSFLSKKRKALFNPIQKREIFPPEPFSSFKEAHSFCLNWIGKHPLNKTIRFFQR